ncbi:MFS transporter [Microlunatus sp. Y2014]|uniref:MFS transporter n=1 Tax=Microlunatus sp. Y2014 TaxID=3418488 RepID=UPI003DA6F056
MRWQRLIIPVYGPTALASIGMGATLPLIALTARSLGADVGTAALLVGLIGLGQLLGDLPAGAIAHRFGERRALVGAGLVEVLAFGTAAVARDVVVLAAAVLVMGLANAVFGLARHAYLTEAVPIRNRAKALSALGGTFRIGTFLGPFVAAGMLLVVPLSWVYGFAAVMSLGAALLAMTLPDLPTAAGPAGDAEPAAPRAAARGLSMWQVLYAHRRVLLLLGSGILTISAVRAARQGIVPLWCEHIGLDASTASIVYGISGAVDMVMFLPGGALMDRMGRVWGAVPAMIVLGLGFVLLPLSHGLGGVIAVACLLGLGNGFSSGIVMTLGADEAPMVGRAKFLGGWRLCADIGGATGPFLISAVTLLVSLGAASVAIGVVGWLGAGWLARWIGRVGPNRLR